MNDTDSIYKMRKGRALFKRVVLFAIAFLVIDDMHDLSRTSMGQAPPSTRGPQTPSGLIMGLDSVDIAPRFDKHYTTVAGSDASNPSPIKIDVVKQTGLPAGLFGLNTILEGTYGAVRLNMEDTGNYIGTDPCDGTDVTQTDADNNDPRSVIKLPGGVSGVNGQVVTNYTVPHPVNGVPAGYIQLEPFRVGATPVEIRLVYRASDSLICASSDPPVDTVTGLSLPEGIAFDPVNQKIAVTNNDVSTLQILDYNQLQSPPLTIAGSGTGLSNPFGVYVDVDPNPTLSHNEIGVANSGNNSVTVYSYIPQIPVANSQIMLDRTLSGDETELSSPAGIAYDSSNDQIVVANGGNNSLTIYPRTNWINLGNQPPLRKILREDYTITSSNNSIVLTETGGVGPALVSIVPGSYATGADLATAVQSALNTAAPSTKFSVSYNTGTKIFSISVDSFSGGVSSVSLNWNDPSSTAAGVLGFYPLNSGPLFAGSIDTSDFGDLTGLNAPCGVYVDTANNEIGVTNNGNDSVTVYDRTPAKENASPKRTLIGSNTGLSNPCGIYVDTTHNEIGVVNSGTNTITIYDRTANGNVPPLRTVRGSPAALNIPVGIYIDPSNDQIGVANPGNGTLTIYQREYDFVQLKALPLLVITPIQQVLFPQYNYHGNIVANDGDPNSIAFDGYKLIWKITDARLRQASDVSQAKLVPPSDAVFQLMDNSLASNFPLGCAQFTPFIIVQLSTNCTPPLIQAPTPVASGSYTIPAVVFKQTVINKVSLPESPLTEPEFPRPVPTLTVLGDNSINRIDWNYVSEPPIINSQEVQIFLNRPFNNVNPCYKLVQGNNLNLIYDSGPLTPDVRSVPTDNNHPINNPQPAGCPIYFNDVQSITYIVTDALEATYIFTWQP